MNNLISKILALRGIKTKDELTAEERADFDRWEHILSKGDMSVDVIKQFCQNQVSIIDKSLRDLDNSPAKNERLILQRLVYSTIINSIEAPQLERESLEKYLQSLLH